MPRWYSVGILSSSSSNSFKTKRESGNVGDALLAHLAKIGVAVILTCQDEHGLQDDDLDPIDAIERSRRVAARGAAPRSVGTSAVPASRSDTRQLHADAV